MKLNLIGYIMSVWKKVAKGAAIVAPDFVIKCYIFVVKCDYGILIFRSIQIYKCTACVNTLMLEHEYICILKA